jgi:hypothetical protein
MSNLNSPVAVWAVVILATTASAQPVPILDYDASRSTLPSAQCWELSGTNSPTPTVVEGELRMGPTSGSQTQTYQHLLLFDFLRDHIIME